jgi:hypothetical protein
MGAQATAKGAQVIATGAQVIATGAQVIATGAQVIATGAQAIGRGATKIGILPLRRACIARQAEVLAKPQTVTAAGNRRNAGYLGLALFSFIFFAAS